MQDEITEMANVPGKYKALLVTDDEGRFEKMKPQLLSVGIDCAWVTPRELESGEVDMRTADVLFITLNSENAQAGINCLATEPNAKLPVPVIAIISKDALFGCESLDGIDDFIIEPCDLTELTARMKRIVKKRRAPAGGEVIKCGDMTIDLKEHEVYINNKRVDLTFREYELLCFMAGDPGRVFTRDMLLDKVWGYDFYGGDRTVDVHIRRLRSKIEDPDHTFIETMRNMGYRFKKET